MLMPSEQIGQAPPAHGGRLLQRPIADAPRHHAAALADLKHRLAAGNAALLAAGSGIFCAHTQNVFVDINDNAARGDNLIFGRAPSPFGQVFVAASNLGLCALRFIDNSDDATTAHTMLQKQWRHAQCQQDADAAARWARRAFDNPPSSLPARLPVPLHVRGTPFQIKVWQALLAIPQGNVASYTALAQVVLGVPSGARAVARAAATNPIAALIPCHRLLHADGDLAGYAWGVARKRDILAAEFARAPIPAAARA